MKAFFSIFVFFMLYVATFARAEEGGVLLLPDNPDIISPAAESISISYDPTEIDYGLVVLNEFGAKQIKLKNIGQQTVHIKQVISSNPDIVVSPQSITLNPQDETAFVARWTAHQPGKMSAIISFIFDSPIDTIIKVNAKGEAIQGNISFTSSIKFGATPDCEKRIGSLLIVNTGQTTIIVHDMSISGSDAIPFSFADAVKTPLVISKGDTLVRKILYYGGGESNDGPKIAQVNFMTEIDSKFKEYTIYLSAEKASINVSPKSANVLFPDTYTGSKSNIKYKIKNESRLPVKIENIAPKSYPGIFSVSPVTIPVLNPGDSADINISFKPQDYKTYIDQLVFRISMQDCKLEQQWQVKGTGIKAPSAIASLPDTVAAINSPGNYDSFGIPVYLNINQNSVLQNVTYTARISFDASFFTPDSTINGKITNEYISGGQRIIEISGTKSSITQKDNLLDIIMGRLYLGDADYTTLTLEDFKLSNIDITTSTTDGRLEVNGVCKPGLLRIEFMNTPFVTITPNPAVSKAEISIGGKVEGKVNILVYSLDGNEVDRFDMDNSKPDKKLLIDLNNYSSGTYQVVALINGEVFTGRLVVAK